VPIENATMEDRTVIEWDKDDLDRLGILKIDVLALGMLTCIRKAFVLVDKHHDRRLDLATVPPEEPAVYEMLSRTDSLGVFQVESRAQMSIPPLKPREFYTSSSRSRLCGRGRSRSTWCTPICGAALGESPSNTLPTHCAKCWAKPWACRSFRSTSLPRRRRLYLPMSTRRITALSGGLGWDCINARQRK
jgi:Bacterial DNA polymerase III alpha subunit finger domain